MGNRNWLSLREIFTGEYKEIMKQANWTPEYLETFGQGMLVQMEYDETRGCTIFYRESLNNLLVYRNSVIDSMKVNIDSDLLKDVFVKRSN